MLLDSSNGQTGDKIMLLSPRLSLSNSSLLKFSYHMWLNESDTDGALAVYRYTRLHTYDMLLFEARGNGGNKWLSGEACIPAGNYTLAFVGTVGLPLSSDIAVDNIEVTEDSGCDRPSLRGLVFTR